MKNYKYGIQKGIPIFLGYLPVSFTFGFMAVSGGLPVWLAVFISVTNLTSAGQFAGTNLIFAQAGYLEIALTTFVINLRYSLMSLSLSQKIHHKTPVWKRLIFSFGITDETFVVASMESGTLSAGYLLGLVPGHLSGRLCLHPASPVSAECHGSRSVCYVYRSDRPGIP